MKTEEELISKIKHNLHELEIEAYGERRHGNKEMPPNIHHFLHYFKDLYQAAYDLGSIDEQEYVPQMNIDMMYDVEREVEGELYYIIEKKNNRELIADLLPALLLRIQGSLSCIIDKI